MAYATFAATFGELGTAQTLSIQCSNTAYRFSIRYDCGSATGAICTKVSNKSISFTPSVELAKQYPYRTSVPVVYTLYVFESGADDAKELERTQLSCIYTVPASVKPSCTISLTDVLGHVSKYSGYVQGKSEIEVAVITTTAQNSPILDCVVSVDGIDYNTDNVVFTPKSSGTLTITATVTDARKRTFTATQTITVLPYSAPSAKLTAQRTDSGWGNGIDWYFTYSGSDLAGKNTATYTMSVRSTHDSSFSNVSNGTLNLSGKDENGAIIEQVVIGPAFNPLYYNMDGRFEFLVTITDDFETVTYTATITAKKAYMDWAYANNSFGMGQKTTRQSAFECGLTQYDKFGTLVGNGLSAYTESSIDPNTTLEELCLTDHANAPEGQGTEFFIHTAFYVTKSTTAERAQTAFPKSKTGSTYHRYFQGGTWSGWARYMTADEVFPVNSVVIMYSHDSPAALYGGTWHRMQSRFLWGTTTEGTIGATAGEMTHTLTVAEMPSHAHNAHTIAYAASATTSSSYYEAMRSAHLSATHNGDISNTHETGGGAAHNNMPPYVNVAIWRRTA